MKNVRFLAFEKIWVTVDSTGLGCEESQLEVFGKQAALFCLTNKDEITFFQVSAEKF
ncbi:MAG: hypothetical protein AB1652_11230 [Bacillota bacterium]